MKNGLSQYDSENRISKRLFILDNLEYLIGESVYYRTHSEVFMNSTIKIEIGNIQNEELRAKIL